MYLRSDVAIGVKYRDQTRFGSPVDERPDALARNVFYPLKPWAEFGGTLDAGVADVVRSGSLFNVLTRADGRLCEQLLYPPAALAQPRFLSFGDNLRMQLTQAHWPEVHRLISSLTNEGLERPEITHPDVGLIFDALGANGMLTEQRREILAGADLTFVGHNTVVIRDQGTTIVVDPLFLPTSLAYPTSYQPVGLDEIGPLDAVLVTHSHRDHFDPATLLRIPANTTIYVPAVARESLLTIDMAYRLAELGFTDVRPLRWDDTARIGSIMVRAMPFYGEQPSDGPRLHPEVRNEGCTYHVTTSTWKCVLLADSGSDQDGNVKDLATSYRGEYGPVDVVFSGYRGWATYPPQLLGSSVARYLLFVAPDQWRVLNRLMSSVDDAIDVAERWGAHYLCPYGDGGAPWYWQRGLGPQLDGTRSENTSFDPFPERVVHAAAVRSVTVDGRVIPASVEVLLLRPGQGLNNIATRPELIGRTWPYSTDAASC
jgi:L-ascorbate metabolism protein UlaG (beta-lactamase superfamily)